MPTYFYKAKNLLGREITGSREVSGRKELIDYLKVQGYFLLSFNQKDGSNGKKPSNQILTWLACLENLFGVPLTEKIFFTRNLAV
ncbi:hypothetical protein FJ208_00745, partial [Candidatus Gribaldobacteria bacterium]|nr:hypothetical protein [Candidatus Gribaldobacteria bacterium]